MKPDITPAELLDRLRLPAQDLSTLSFCNSSRASKVADWAAQLPATRINHTSVLLYQALPEVCRLATPPANRLEMLEQLRPYVQQCIQGLTKSFLGQPLILPEEAMKTAVIAQALQKHLCNGYCLVAKQWLQQPDSRDKDGQLKEDVTRSLTLAIHRAITGMGLQLLRNAQVYTQASSQLWLELNSLYGLAEQLQLHHKPVRDPLLRQTGSCNIEQAYCQVLLLTCAQPNQLRQMEVQYIHDTLELCAPLVHLTPLRPASNNCHVIDLQAAGPPAYKSQLPAADQTASLRELDLTALLEALRRHQQGTFDDALDLPPFISPALLRHLIGAWSEERQRLQPRHDSQDQLDIVVGLNNVHRQLADGLAFDVFLRQRCNTRRQSGSLFRSRGLEAEHDPWAEAFDAEPAARPRTSGLLSRFGKRDNASRTDSDTHGPHRVQVLDVSPGGFGLQWREQTPSQLRAGELVAVRQPQRRQWNLGVIRWVRQHRGLSQLGIQLIAQQPVAVALQQLQKSGSDNVPMRALLSSKAGEAFTEQAIITASHPFREHNKVRLNRQGELTTAQLTRLIYSTSSVSLFSFRALEDAVRDETGPPDTPPPSDRFPGDW